MDQGGDVGVTGKKIGLKVRIRLSSFPGDIYYYYCIYNDLVHYYRYPFIYWICDLLLFLQNALIKKTGVNMTLTVA